MIRKPIALSYSREKDMACPFRFNAIYIEKTFKEPDDKKELAIGSAIADILKGYREHCLARRMRSDIEYLRGLHIKDPWASEIRELLNKFIDSPSSLLPQNPPWHVVEGEFAFNGQLMPLGRTGWMSPECRYRLKVDFAYREGDALIIIDDKSGRGDPDPRQLKIYSSLVAKAYLGMTQAEQVIGLQRVVTVFNMLASGRPIIDEHEVGATDDVQDEIMRHLAEVNAWMEFPPVACKICGYCGVPFCPLKREAEKAVIAHSPAPAFELPEQIAGLPQARRMVEFLTFVEQLEKRCKGMLREYVEEHGPVGAAGKIAELRPADSWAPHDMKDFWTTLFAYGLSKEVIFEFLSFREKDLLKLVKKHKHLKPRYSVLLAMGTRRALEPKFGLYKDQLTA